MSNTFDNRTKGFEEMGIDLNSVDVRNTYFEEIGVGYNLEEYEVEQLELMLPLVNEAVAFLNELNDESWEIEFIPNLAILRREIGDLPIPQLEELSKQSLYFGFQWASDLSRSQLIKTPSRTVGQAQVVGTVLHGLERSMMLELMGQKNHGRETIEEMNLLDKTDLIIYPIEEVLILLFNIEVLGEEDVRPELARFVQLMITSVDEGGLGWRTEDDVNKVYTALRARADI